MMKQSFRKVKGQSLIIVVLCALALLGLVALALDGGNALVQRRVMQDGADAGALAAVQLMEGNIAVSCSPTPCHPTYLITNQTVGDRITQLVTANRGGVIGAASYSILIEYHFMAGAPTDADSYRPAADYPASDLIPAFVDGVRVAANVANPTTFARAINIQTIPVGAVAAARLYGTCPSLDMDGDTIPMTRFRPAVEDFLNDNPGNDPCNLFEFWSPQGDFSQMKNLISFNVYSFKAQGPLQPMAGFDMRNGTSGGLVNYGSSACPPSCADMRGSNARQDVQNWIYHQWQGLISLTTLYSAGSGTWAPANRTNGGGSRNGSPTRPGDWVETYTSGNWGSNVSDPLYDAALAGVMVPYLSPAVSQGGLGWGPAIDRKIYLWGPEEIGPGDETTDYAQEWQNNVLIPTPYCTPTPTNNCKYKGWEDLEIRNSGSAASPSYAASNDWHNGSVSIDRVRMTRAIMVRFFANLQGNGHGAQAPTGCALPTLSNSRAWGLILSESVTDPNGDCGWQVGGAVYSRLIDP